MSKDAPQTKSVEEARARAYWVGVLDYAEPKYCANDSWKHFLEGWLGSISAQAARNAEQVAHPPMAGCAWETEGAREARDERGLANRKSGDSEPQSPPSAVPATTDNSARMYQLIEEFGTAVTDMFEQMERGNWVDDHGHDVRLNAKMADLIPLIEKAIALRAESTRADYSPAVHMRSVDGPFCGNPLTGDETATHIWKEVTCGECNLERSKELTKAARTVSKEPGSRDRSQRLEDLHDWAVANIPEMDCRSDNDCDHCFGIYLLDQIKEAKVARPDSHLREVVSDVVTDLAAMEARWRHNPISGVSDECRDIRRKLADAAIVSRAQHDYQGGGDGKP